MQKYKKIHILIAIMIFTLAFLPTTFSKAEAGQIAASEGKAPLLTDELNVLDASLSAKLRDMTEKYKCEVSVTLLKDMPGNYKNAEALADDIYDYDKHGYDSQGSGLMLLIVKSARKVHITTKGKAINYFNDKTLNYILDQMMPSLKDGDFAKSTEVFVDLCDQVLAMEANGKSFKVPREPLPNYWYILAPVIGIILSYFMVGGAKKDTQFTNFKHNNAKNYVIEEGAVLGATFDQFLGSDVTSTLRVDSSDSGSGSSTHTSSSGSTHGGAGRSF